MKLKRIEIKDFKAINNLSHNFTDKPLFITGANGSGKTTFIDAIRFGITGSLPKQPIRTEAKAASVMITIPTNTGDDVEITRIIEPPATATVKIMNKKTTSKYISSMTTDELGLESDVLKATFNDDLMASLNSAKMADFFLRHDKNRMTVVEMLNLAETDTSKKHIKVCGTSEELPIPFKAAFSNAFDKLDADLSDIENAVEKVREKKKETTRDLREAKDKSKGFEDLVEPEYKEKEIQDKLSDILMVEKNIEAARKLRTAYLDAFTRDAEQKKLLESLTAQIAMISDSKPDPKDLKALNEKKHNLDAQFISLKTSQKSFENSIEMFKKTLDDLGSTTCPISGKLICKTDKSGVEGDLKNEVERLQAEVVRVAKEADAVQTDIMNTSSEITQYAESSKRYQKKELLTMQLENLKKSPVYIPEKPEIPIKTNYDIEKKELYDLQLRRKVYDEMKEWNRKRLKLEGEAAIQDYIQELLDKNGLIVTKYAEKTVKMMESACRIELMNKSYKIVFDARNGIVPKFDFGSGLYEYASLSQGEKLLAKAVITDLFSRYFGSQIMILDEMNDLDISHVKELMTFIDNIKNDYSNIVVCTVDHNNIVEEIKKHDVDILQF